MSGETERNESGWTVDTLHMYLQRQLDDQRVFANERYTTQQENLATALAAAEKAVQTALTSAEKAVTKAETAAEKRFEAVNEFRAQLSDQAATFPSRIEVDTRLVAMSEKIADLSLRVENSSGHDSGDTARRDNNRQMVTIAISLGVFLLVLIGTAVAVIAAVTPP